MFLALFGVGLTLIFGLTEDELVYAKYSLALQIIVSLMLGLYFWLLQQKDNDKLQEILKLQTDASTAIHKHVMQQQQIQDSIRSTSFRYIKANLTSAQQQINRMHNYITNYKAASEEKRAFHLDDQLIRTSTFKSYSNDIERQLSIVRPYIQADLALKIESIAGFMRYLWLSSEDESDSRLFVASIPDTVGGWLRQAQVAMQNIEELIAEIQKAEDTLKSK